MNESSLPWNNLRIRSLPSKSNVISDRSFLYYDEELKGFTLCTYDVPLGLKYSHVPANVGTPE